jgi:pyruvate dehydrogenase (quinone)
MDFGQQIGFEAMHQADVRCFGNRFPYSEFFRKMQNYSNRYQTRKISVEPKVDLGYCGDIKLTLKELMPLVEIKLPLIFWTKCVHYIKILK